MSSLVPHITALFMLVMGLSLLFQARQWLALTRDAFDAPWRFFAAAMLMTVFGATIVATHNRWSLGWEVAITIYGWALLIKGAALLIAPGWADWFKGWSDRFFLAWMRVGGAILAVIGAILTYQLRLAA